MSQQNGTTPPTPEPSKADQRAAQAQQHAAEQDSAKQNVNLAVLSGKLVGFRPDSATEMWLLAQYFFAAKKMLPERLGSVGDVFMTLMAGRSLDLDPMTAIRGIDCVEGKIFIEGDLVHAILNTKLKVEDGEYVRLVESTAKGATYEFMRKGWKEPQRGTFAEEDAKAAGLLEKKGPWQNYRKAMYRHRAMVTWAREFCPEWFLGVYSTEEREDFGRDVNDRPGSGIIPATKAPTEVDVAPPSSAPGSLPPPAPKERIEDPKPAEPAAAERTAAPAQQQAAPSTPAPQQTEEQRVFDIVGKAETPEGFAAALGHIQNLNRQQQIEPRIALIRQIDLHLQKPGNHPTAELGKLLFRVVSGLPEDQRDLGQKVYGRYNWKKA